MRAYYRRDQDWAEWEHECILESEDGWAFVWRCKDGRYAISTGETWGEAFDGDMTMFAAQSAEDCIAMAGEMLETFEECEPEFEVQVESYDPTDPWAAELGQWDDFTPWTKEKWIRVEGWRRDVNALVSRVR